VQGWNPWLGALPPHPHKSSAYEHAKYMNDDRREQMTISLTNWISAKVLNPVGVQVSHRNLALNKKLFKS
jgi:hypothetical protein